MLIKFDFSSKTGIFVVKFAFATANLKIETLRMRRRFARVLSATCFPALFTGHVFSVDGNRARPWLQVFPHCRQPYTFFSALGRVIIKKLMSVFHASVLLLTMNFVITLSK